ncbi:MULTISPECIES: amino acid ABC transporter permease [Brevibacillus]|jgi:polar amino acid transport system permease protein|uniref:Amine acid ABC transporter, permease protein, 3-TM region, His/Glu/Gln/Arg/opine family n=1 Tax=Brevibacillus centrosporus TaxID=54910 RepID=A0A1I3LR04_9BACL|nr:MULTISPECIES: amino acid ABC transporter permease [Brevibacillus]MEC2131337.1 amino acid ABC transporter permease [Brevibacillus centrosporus]MED1951222.1 amino acid ABC transporter permease [Brevibacillus centrosporus]MED4906862.1 amino acid ABC transporter permease [Brevibacillus centrosporus]RNB72629.1 amino acid ABC transporter permease [Brevibacillus centrosporus]SFI86980.1 amine acid ABC transporter, permease protein, 3-TM region, His/Glu/Gln/Arg/opine family [Brevibacillus centrospor
MGSAWDVIPQNIGLLMDGLWLTLQLSACALVVSIPIGILLGLLRISRNRILSFLAVSYVEFVRGVPLLVLLFWIYFVLGKWLKLGPFLSGVMGLGLFSAAFIAEIVRAGIQAVPRGQMEAARSSGMSYVQAMRFIVLPQAMRKVLPPMASQFITLIKDSSLVSVISVVDLTLVAKNLVSTSFRSLEVWSFVAIMYFCITFFLSQVIRAFERRYRVSE